MEALYQFIQSYHQELEDIFDQRGRNRYPFHGDRCASVMTFEASDGYVSFYRPPGARMQDVPGYHRQIFRDYTLNEICQSYTLNFLRVFPPDIGQQAFMPREMPPPPDRKVPRSGPLMFSRGVVEGAAAKSLGTVRGVAVSPILNVRSGIIKSISPHRLKLWSPTIDIPGRGIHRQYHWTHADFWWLPESLDLDPSVSKDIAFADIMALETLLSQTGELPAEIISQANGDSSQAASSILNQLCEEFSNLLDDESADEETIHQWLNNERHHIFLDPDAVRVWSKLEFGEHISDFVVRRSNGTYILIEIEPAKFRIFTKRGAEPSQQFKHACQQVNDWQIFIGDNVRYVRAELGLDEISPSPPGIVILGRSRDIDSPDAQKRWEHMKRTHKPAAFTYDDAIERVRTLAGRLETIMTNLHD